MKTRVAVIGGGGFGREVKAMVDDFFPDQIFEGFIDDNPRHNTLPEFAKVTRAYIAVADPKSRKSLAARPQFHPLIGSLIHPSVQLHQSNVVGRGSIICGGVKITTNVIIGEFNIINLNTVIGHDVVTGAFCSIMPSSNILGGVQLGEGVFVGAGATILQNVTVGDYAVIGAGSVITKNVEAQTKVFGVPGTKRA